MIRPHGTPYDALIAYVNVVYLACCAKGMALWAGLCACERAQKTGFPALSETADVLLCPLCGRRISEGVMILGEQRPNTPVGVDLAQ